MRIKISSVFALTAFAVMAGASCSDFADTCEGMNTPCGGAGTTGGTSGKGGAAAGGSSSGGDAQGGGQGGDIQGGSAGSESGGAAGATGGGGGSSPCDGSCGGDTAVCDEATETCVECLGSDDCDGATSLCDTDSNECVECLSNDDCDSATASKCSNGECVSCAGNGDCSHIAGKGVCDTDEDECVECTVADEDPCEGNSCNPATNACTDTTIGSVGSCEPCVADSECSGGGTADPNARCVPMEFEDVLRPGGFCLRRQSKGCSQPLTVTLAATSLSGASAENYCGLNEAVTRCEAVLDMVAGASCSDGLDSSCGCHRDGGGACTDTGEGGLCRTVGGVDDTCTVACGSSNDCVSGKVCTLDDPYCH
jgi:hypothetical protein